MDALTGNETQIGQFQIIVHDDADIEDVSLELKQKLDEAFGNEPGHRLVRISYQRGHKLAAANATHEHLLYADLEQYIKARMNDDYFPLIFQAHCFVSFSPLKLVKE
ncbi:hypothetical protein ACK8P5_26390 (plasmid) [Paenibacillus sp. EC2-1]|uniref:hypothetical protein n=1 Tax=Paenibacillus sp. EC2-1 TaxID=3388665 RepID=UPI003BEEF448